MNYIPLRLKTENSLLESLIKINDLIHYAKKNNLKALAISDNNMFGVLEFYNLCIQNDIKPIIGYEFIFNEKQVVVYAKSDLGYRNLIKISSNEITLELLKEHSKDLICILPFESNNLDELKDLYENFYIGYSSFDEKRQIDEESVYFKKVLYLEKTDRNYYKYLYSLKESIHVSLIKEDFDNHFELESSLYNENNKEIIDMINLKINFHENLLPIYDCPNSHDSESYLKLLCKEGLKRNFGDRVNKEYIDRLKYELDIINEMGFSNYFLIVHDYVKFAKEQNILVGPGRGSAAGSLVSYCLNITTVDPIKYNLLFERFLNPERVTLPDIDIDFEDARRDEVINYCINKYGIKRATGIITFGTLGAKQVIRDLGKSILVDNKIIDYVAKMLDSKLSLQENFNKNIKLQNYVKQDKQLSILYKVAVRLEGLKRHTSIHAAGVVMSKYDLDTILPIVKSTENFYTTAYSMDYLEQLGLLKMDFLGLKNLTLINDILNEFKINKIDFDFDKIPMDDKKTFDLFKRGNTKGIFQFESIGMVNFLKKFKPNNFDEISDAIALFRPGPMDNIDLYIKRRNNEEKINYFHPKLEEILKPTYGIIVYQEQIMQIANVMAGYSMGEADILRRAMSKKKHDVLAKEREKFIKRALELNYDQKTINAVYDLILKFASYGFNKAHAVAYSMISYKMAYLKANHPKYFIKALLKSSVGSEIKTKEYIYEAKLNNIEILKPEINISNRSYVINNNGIRYPISNIKNVGSVSVNQILDERKKGNFKDIFDFTRRLYSKTINKKAIESLIDASLFSSFGYNHKTLHENLDIIINYAEIASETTPRPELKIYPEYPNKDLLEKELSVFGFYLTSHPLTEYKIKYPNTININKIPNFFDKNIEILLYIDNIKEVKTKKGEDMLFMDTSDELDSISVVLFPKVYAKYNEIKPGEIYLTKAKVEKRFDSYQLIANELLKVN